MSDIGLQIKGLDKFQKVMGKSPIITAKAFSDAIKESLIDIQSKTRPITPIDTGRLRTSIGARNADGIFKVKGLVGSIGSDVEYAWPVHEKHRTKSKFLLKGTKKAVRDIKKNFERAIETIFKTISLKSKF